MTTSESSRNGYTVSNGLISETPETKQNSGKSICGDGTVPYWSLHHVKEWESQVSEVSIFEIDGAEHREILADPRFHNEVLRYCLLEKESV